MDETVLLGHGSGGSMMRRIIDEVFLEAYGTDELLPGRRRGKCCRRLAPGERLAYSTDSFVVTPHFFPGGNIGRLGCVRHRERRGHQRRRAAIPQCCGFILEEGFPMDDLRSICATMAETAQRGRRAVSLPATRRW